MNKVYIIIPSVNGEIDGDPFLKSSINDVDFYGECVVYEINLVDMTVKEVDQYILI